ERVAPRTPVERRLAEVWCDVLGVAEVGVHDSLFDLGGNSLVAIQLVSRIRQDLGVEIPLRQLFQEPSVAALARRVSAVRAERAEAPALPFPVILADPARRHEPFPLNDVQQAYWVGRTDLFELGGVASHGYREVEVRGLDLDRLAAAFRRLIARHDMLRAVVRPDGLQQVLAEVPPYEIAVTDLRGRPAAEVEAALAALRQEMSHQVLPADRWPLFDVRATLLDGSGGTEGGGDPRHRVRLHVSVDILLVDAWSARILGRELAYFYADPEAELAPLELSFRDYVLAERAMAESDWVRRSRDYWQRRLDTLPPAPELPMAKTPAELEHTEFARREGSLAAPVWSRIKERAARLGATPSGVVLAAFAEVLARWSKDPRFTINLTLFNRLPMHPQVNDIVGDFTSLTLLEVDGAAAPTFELRCRALQEQLWEDLEHRYVSGVEVMRGLARRRGGGHGALMPVVFTSALFGDATGEPELTGGLEDGEGIYGISQTPQVWLDHQVSEVGGMLAFNWDTVDELFPPGLLDDMFGEYVALLERLASEEAAWSGAAGPWAVEIPPAAVELQRRANDTAVELPAEVLLHDAFFARAAEAPERVAVIAPDRTLTYGELAARAAVLGHRLRARLGGDDGAVAADRLVAVVMDKGWEQVAAVLGVLAAGAAYLPVDAGLPEERVHQLLALGEVDLAVVQPAVEERFAWPAGVERVVVGGEAPSAGEPGADGVPPAPVRAPEDLAYVIFTSGSTGVPKGVMIEHRAAANTLADVGRRFAVGPEDRVLALSSLSFDLSVYDVFGLLGVGG
ncbi:MAG TPA: AMP-binding protein, partial [Thermoanaerobaculia bacterium]|nr:AMP-binding protein [Thermoanaerobaculia bacterium]